MREETLQQMMQLEVLRDLLDVVACLRKMRSYSVSSPLFGGTVDDEGAMPMGKSSPGTTTLPTEGER